MHIEAIGFVQIGASQALCRGVAANARFAGLGRIQLAPQGGQDRRAWIEPLDLSDRVFGGREILALNRRTGFAGEPLDLAILFGPAASGREFALDLGDQRRAGIDRLGTGDDSLGQSKSFR